MLYANFLILIFLLLLYIISIKHTDKKKRNLDKKEHKFAFLYPMAEFLLNKIGLEKSHQDIQTKLNRYKKTSFILVVVFISSSLSLITSVQYVLNSFDGILIRPEEEDGDGRIMLRFRMENEADDKDVYEDEIVIRNNARIYSEEEWRQVLDNAISYLEVEVLGENEDFDNVYTNLNFINKIPGTGITVEWLPKDYRLITDRGELQNMYMTDDKVVTTVKAILKYRDRRVEHTIPLTIRAPVSDDKEKLYQKLQNVIDEIQIQTGKEKNWSLPRKLGNYIINWERPEANPAVKIFVLGLFAAILIWFLGDKDLEKKIKLRKNQMLFDYPEIINKFNLLLNAGMTIKQAWFKISEDYKKKIDNGEGSMRYAYEEMVFTLHELKLGIPESHAYEQFGQRTGLLPYMKFSTLLVQNLKKGNKYMVDLLKIEALEAIRERKEATKRLGEEASAKLLGPMVIMLLIVLIIIILPAFISFKI